jgi:hypothetical protein
MPEIRSTSIAMILLALFAGLFAGGAAVGSLFYLRGWRLPGDRAQIEQDAYKAGFDHGISRAGWTSGDE